MVDAPVRSRFWLRAWASFAFFGMFTGQFFRNLLGYWGFTVAAAIVCGVSVVVLIVLKPSWNWRHTPKTLFAFVGFATLSIAWSFYPGASVLGVIAQWMSVTIAFALALTLTWPEFLRTFGVGLRWALGLSLLFELWVSLFVGHPILPNFMQVDGPVPKAFYWSRNLLLQGGPIEGIVANRNLLGFIALLALIVFSVQLAAQTVRRGWGIAWLAFAAMMFLLTRSATAIVAAVVVAIVLALALWTRSVGPDRRRPIYLTAFGGAVLLALGVWLARGPLLALLGKSEDLTGRFDIWNIVYGMFTERPVAGWGWVSYWAPWVEPFNDLVVIKGVTYLQAHNAWLDVAMQLGVIGLLLFAALVGSTLWRSWFLAVDRPRFGLSDAEPFAASALLPLLLMTALIVQSLAESRLLIEGNFILLVALAALTKRRQWSREVMP